jgi:triosephosphate isomerase
MRTLLIAGNWKMNKTPQETINFAETFRSLLKEKPKNEILVCPPFTSLYILKKSLDGLPVKLGAQNMHWALNGAYTGEISGLFLKELGCEYVILGHSERREYFHETDEVINKKLKTALEIGLNPILCVGESLAQREGGLTFEIITTQLANALNGIKINPSLVIAYEPIWAIGTGKSATPKEAEEVHEFIRTYLAKNFGIELASVMRIIYGGSVNPQNIKDLLAMSEIDGVLIGNASLEAENFVKMAFCTKT